MADKQSITIRYPKNWGGFRKFLTDVIAAAADGYTLSEDAYNGESKPAFGGRLSITLFKEDPKSKEVEPKVEGTSGEVSVALLDNPKAGKKDLLELAEKLGIEVPAEVKFPKSIVKFLKEKISEKDKE